MSAVYNLQTYVRDRKLPYLILCILRGPCIFVLVGLLLFRQLSQSTPSSYTLESILGVLLDHTCYDYFSYNFSSSLIRRLHDFIISYLRLKARDFLSTIGTLKNGGNTNIKGRPINIKNNTPCYGYIIIYDITPKIKEWMKIKGFIPTPDGLGWFRFNNNLNFYIEVKSWDKVLYDVEIRHKSFFKKSQI